jgi:hypothetical protein
MALESRTCFNDIAETSLFAYGGKFPEEVDHHVQYVLKEFDALFTAIEKASNEDDLAALEERPNELENQVAYILPISYLAEIAQVLLDELVSWEVPPKSIRQVSAFVEKLRDPKVPEVDKRNLYLLILEEHDYRSGYVDWANKRFLVLKIISSVFAIGSLAAALALLDKNFLLLGFLLAGVSGASLSVLLKFPNIMDYGEFYKTMLDIFSRFTTGLVAAVIGLGFLASGIISPSFTFEGEPKSVATVIKNFGTSGNPPVLSLLVLLSLGLIFGFSERLFYSFESTFLERLLSRKGEASDKADKKKLGQAQE